MVEGEDGEALHTRQPLAWLQLGSGLREARPITAAVQGGGPDAPRDWLAAEAEDRGPGVAAPAVPAEAAPAALPAVDLDVLYAQVRRVGMDTGFAAQPDLDSVAAALERRAAALREAQGLQHVLRGTSSLLAAVSTGDAELIERACQAAEGAGVSASAVATARLRVRQLREASLLAAAVGGSDPDAIEHQCRDAERCGVGDGVVGAARERAVQLREARLLASVVQSDDAAEIDRQCDEAEAGGVGEATVQAARRRARQLREEDRLHDLLREGRLVSTAVGVSRTLSTEDHLDGWSTGRESPRSGGSGGGSSASRDSSRDEGGVEVQGGGEERHMRLQTSAWVAAAVQAMDLAMEQAGQQDAPSLAARAEQADRILVAARERARQLGGSARLQSCTICFEPLTAEHRQGTDELGEGVSDEDVCALPCRHAFHCGCLVGWLRSQTTCPNCRVSVAPDLAAALLAPGAGVVLAAAEAEEEVAVEGGFGPTPEATNEVHGRGSSVAGTQTSGT